MIPVYFRSVTKNGSLIYNSGQEIRILVSGEGAGRRYDQPYRYQSSEGGRWRWFFAFVPRQKKAGKITVKATAEGLFAGEAEISTRPFEGNLPDEEACSVYGEEEAMFGKTFFLAEAYLGKPRLKIASVPELEAARTGILLQYNHNDRSYCGGLPEDQLPQVVTLMLDRPTYVAASRILFRKTVLPKHKVGNF